MSDGEQYRDHRGGQDQYTRSSYSRTERDGGGRYGRNDERAGRRFDTYDDRGHHGGGRRFDTHDDRGHHGKLKSSGDGRARRRGHEEDEPHNYQEYEHEGRRGLGRSNREYDSRARKPPRDDFEGQSGYRRHHDESRHGGHDQKFRYEARAGGRHDFSGGHDQFDEYADGRGASHRGGGSKDQKGQRGGSRGDWEGGGDFQHPRHNRGRDNAFGDGGFDNDTGFDNGGGFDNDGGFENRRSGGKWNNHIGGDGEYSGGRDFRSGRHNQEGGWAGGGEEGGGANFGINNNDDMGGLDDLAQALESMSLDIQNKDWSKFDKDIYQEHPKLKEFDNDEMDRIRACHKIKVVSGDNIPCLIPVLSLAPFPKWIMDPLNERFKAPLPIQMQAWPLIMSGRDVYGVAETGSGKTLAFLLPGFVHIAHQPPVQRDEGPIALVISPTRELALQIQKEAESFEKHAARETHALDGQPLRMRSVCVYGGLQNSRELATKFREGVEMVVACPGRLMDLTRRGMLKTDRVTYFVLDEADKLLDHDFSRHVVAFSSMTRRDRQTLLWSATWPDTIAHMARNLCQNDPVHLNIGVPGIKTVKGIKQLFLRANDRFQKREIVREKVSEHSEYRWLVFCNQRDEADSLTEYLKKEMNEPVVSLHGKHSQMQREQSINQFRNGRVRILVSTDVLSRGIDIDKIFGVVLYDMPRDVETYTHRIGRCGRAGRNGEAVSLVGYNDMDLCRMIQQSIKANELDSAKFASELDAILAEDGGGGDVGFDGGFDFPAEGEEQAPSAADNTDIPDW